MSCFSTDFKSISNSIFWTLLEIIPEYLRSSIFYELMQQILLFWSRLREHLPHKNPLHTFTMGLILSLIKQEKEIPFVDISFDAVRKEGEPVVEIDLDSHLQVLQQYNGCAEEIRLAISQPNPQSEENAYKVLVPAIQKLQQLYEFCQSVGMSFFFGF
jgi:hypothetical protein